MSTNEQVPVYIKKMEKILSGSVSAMCTSDKIGVVFSAGVDSTLISLIVSRYKPAVLYNVGAANSIDGENAKRFLEHITENTTENITVNFIDIEISDIKENFHDILKSSGTKNPVKFGASIPLYFASQAAAGDGIRIMTSGQGGDELFGGYEKYMAAIRQESYTKAADMMESDIEQMYEENIKREEGICKSNHVKIKYPYLGAEFTDYSRSIPYELKILKTESGEFQGIKALDEIDGVKYIRKFILKKFALNYGVPGFIVNRSKKAAQYGSGAHKMRKRRGFSAKGEKRRKRRLPWHVP